MRRLHSTLKFVVGHVLAGSVIILGTLFITLVCYIISLIRARDAFDTPVAVFTEFLMIMGMAGIFGAIVSTGSCVIAALLQWLRMKWHFPFWLPLLAVPLVGFVIVFLIYSRKEGMSFVMITTGLVFFYFGIYWTLLTSAAAVLDFLRCKLSGTKPV